MRTRQPKPPQLRSPRLYVLVRVLFSEQGLEILNWARFVRELIGAVLGVFSELELGVFLDGAFGWLEGAGYEVQEGGLASTIGAEDGYAGVHAIR